ncbi:hypothetical protein CDL12_03011 [Handroanthus impetiginosus]|uniref:PB1 domain-containing protein n=1 Tax=Handroanthus impetiginosus TaxID=429701 RepID=A0A2G9I3D6_9LAMI|nr:hypothetical protein CDL12_03011 [Handroanthus impetiginosus]
MSVDRVMTAPRIISCRSAPNSAPSSPKNRLKFLCSHGGRILPRPSDGHLKYVGGETRVISVPRDIPFQELMKKLTYLIDGEMILKYQVVFEDLDALVTVKSDEDLRHMFDEIDRCESLGCPRLRAFLFPVNPVVIENQIGSVDHHALEQRYIDSINGIIRSSPFPTKQHPTISTVQHGSLVSSACSSPRSPDSSSTTETISMNGESMFQMNYHTGRTSMHKVLSSPSLCSLNIPHQSSTHYVNQVHPQYHQNYRQAHQLYYQSPKLPIDSHKSCTPDRLVPIRSVGRADGVGYRIDHIPQYYYSSAFKQNQGSGFCNKCMHSNDFSYRGVIDRKGNFATSSAPPSPRYGQRGLKPWD